MPTPFEKTVFALSSAGYDIATLQLGIKEFGGAEARHRGYLLAMLRGNNNEKKKKKEKQLLLLCKNGLVQDHVELKARVAAEQERAAAQDARLAGKKRRR